MPRFIRTILPTVFVFVIALGIGAARLSGATAEEGHEFFEKKIRPVLVKRCYKCHSARAEKVKGGLLLDTRAGIRMGGESGPVVVPGDPDGSLLIEALRYESSEMPPDEQLPDHIVADFTRWIEMGAPDPRNGKAKLVRQEIDFEKGRQHWAFQPPRKSAPPVVGNTDWPRDDIDRFVLARLEQEKLTPVADADSLTLIRRLYMDLTGLPPTPEQIDSLGQDTSRGALEALVDQLLASPQFGERWGRHWLDVARYAESNGRERNVLFPHAWRYRDYVIKALNEDKPYARFIEEQIAGDLLPAESAAARDELVVATGFLAIGPKLLNERDRETFLLDLVDDQLDVATRGVMALTVTCARCHDHKFDPIPTSEYYMMAGIFRSTDTKFSAGAGNGVRQKSGLIALSQGPSEDAPAKNPQQQQITQLSSRLKQARTQLEQLTGGKAADRKSAKKQKNGQETKPAANRQETAELRQEIKKLTKRLQDLQSRSPSATNVAMGVTEGDSTDIRICIRGEASDRGDLVPRGYLTILSDGEPPRVKSSGSGRLELAEWLTSPDNPLTARVIVNRVWQHLLGHGLVRSVDNFGTTGDAPTHPELLDYLAVSLMEDGWSLKSLIRRIVLTRTYGLSSDFDQDNFQRDPDNFYLWRINSRRLDAEVLRDAMLAASGELDLTPPTGSPVARYRDTDGIGRGVTEGDFDVASKHRSVYLPIVRNAVPDALQVFDFAEPSMIVGQRMITTVPTQALYMMNNPVVVQHADRTAARLLGRSDLDDAARVELAYKLVLSRPPSISECRRALDYVSRTHDKLQDSQKDKQTQMSYAWSGLCQALFASAEFRYLD